MARSRLFLDKLKRFNHAFDEFNCLLIKEGGWPFSQACEDLAFEVYKFRMNEEVISASEDRLKEKLIA